MRNDFAIFILTNGRANDQKTLKMLKENGYTGQYFLVVDNLDEQLEEYQKKYKDHVIVFDKLAAWEITDTFHNGKMLKAVVFPRNVVFQYAREKGIKEFAMCDDDISRLNYKNIEGGKLVTKKITSNIDQIIEAYVNYVEQAKITVLGMCEDGVFIGGVNQLVLNGYTPSIGKFIFFRTADEVKYRGLYYEDNIATYDIPLQGRMSFSPTIISTVSQIDTKKTKGGMHDVYENTSSGYTCSFMVLMAHPSGIKISQKKDSWKVRKSQDNLRPMLLDEKWRKVAESSER